VGASIGDYMPSIIAEKQQIAPDVSIADSAVIHAKRITLATGVKIGANVVLEGESIALASDVVIQNDVTIKGEYHQYWAQQSHRTTHYHARICRRYTRRN
jgi:UDP-3-O-[3-hydroxymyristoyl] glucosamine N-acyltransferase